MDSSSMTNTLLIITGPQGSGNHLFSKIFALHPKVFGWRALLESYWIPHDQEPFAEYWNEPRLLSNLRIDHQYSVTSISCPYRYHGETRIPLYRDFIEALHEFGLTVKLAIIGRDRTILQYQQERVRGGVSLSLFEEQLPYLRSLSPIFLSLELLYLYRAPYVQSIGRILDFPVNADDPRLEEILKEDTNSKYIQPVQSHWLDSAKRQARTQQIRR
jgi:hypothetical protein